MEWRHFVSYLWDDSRISMTTSRSHIKLVSNKANGLCYQ